MKWWHWIIIIVIILAFLFPKPAGEAGSGLPPPDIEYSWVNEECSCFGYKYAVSGAMDAPRSYVCFGIPYSCKCIEYAHNKETQEKTSKEVIC